MRVQIHANIQIRNKNGKIVKDFTRECNSYVRQFVEIIRGSMNNTTDNIIDTTNTARALITTTSIFKTTASSGETTFGIRVGTNSTAVSISDYELGAIIAHGTSSGQLQYGACSVGTPSVVGSTCSFTVARTFTNNSGASITVKEVGLAVANSTRYYLIERTLLNFDIANTESATVTYTISVSV